MPSREISNGEDELGGHSCDEAFATCLRYLTFLLNDVKKHSYLSLHTWHEVLSLLCVYSG